MAADCPQQVRVLLFPVPILIPTTTPHSFIPGGGTIGQLVAYVTSGLSLIPPHELKYIYILQRAVAIRRTAGY
jgi:hypothetical protein